MNSNSAVAPLFLEHLLFEFLRFDDFFRRFPRLLLLFPRLRVFVGKNLPFLSLLNVVFAMMICLSINCLKITSL